MVWRGIRDERTRHGDLVQLLIPLAAVKVLVIEAGPFDKGEDAILKPGKFPPVQYWALGLLGTPQPELNNRVHASLTGRLVGGGSAVNAAVFVRSKYPRQPQHSRDSLN